MSLRFSIPVTLRSLGRGFHVVPEDEIERDLSATPSPIDYQPMFEAGRQVALWLLDVARARTSDPLDHAAIARVRRALALALATDAPVGARPDVSEEDLLTVAGILLTAFEADLGISGLGTIAGRLYDEADGDLDTISAALAAFVADQAAALFAHSTRKRRVVAVVPVLVRRRPRVVDEDALADVLSTR